MLPMVEVEENGGGKGRLHGGRGFSLSRQKEKERRRQVAWVQRRRRVGRESERECGRSEGEGGGPQAGLRLRLSIPGATVSCTPRRCCVSVLQRARHSRNTHTSTRTRDSKPYTYLHGYVLRGRARTPGPPTHLQNRGKVRVRARGRRACATVHTPVPSVERHADISRRETTATVRRRACLSRPSRGYIASTAKGEITPFWWNKFSSVDAKHNITGTRVFGGVQWIRWMFRWWITWKIISRGG